MSKTASQNEGVTAQVGKSCTGRQRTALSGLSRAVSSDFEFEFTDLSFENLYFVTLQSKNMYLEVREK